MTERMQPFERLLSEVATQREKVEQLDAARANLAIYILNSLGPREARRLARDLKWRAYWKDYFGGAG